MELKNEIKFSESLKFLEKLKFKVLLKEIQTFSFSLKKRGGEGVG
jgi:hypothetical protein